MAKKDSEKDSDRPHYYSQFWLDVAAGRRVIGAPKSDEDEADEVLEPVAPRRPTRSATIDDSDGYQAPVVHPQVEDELEEDADEFSTPDLEELDTAEEIGNEDIPTFGSNDEDIPDVDISPVQEETEEVEEPVAEEGEEDIFDEDEEEEEDGAWSARGRKKPKPGRQTKLPAKRPKREPRRGF